MPIFCLDQDLMQAVWAQLPSKSLRVFLVRLPLLELCVSHNRLVESELYIQTDKSCKIC